MRIGELAKRTGVPPRMLRYYEEQGLITPQRLDNGYRDYGDYLVDRVNKIRDTLVTERDRMTQKIEFLIQNRDALTQYIETMDAMTSDSSVARAS